MSAKYKSPSFLLPNEINTNTNPLNTDGDSATGTGVNSLYSMDFDGNNEYIDLGNGLGGINGVYNGSLSISLWFKESAYGYYDLFGTTPLVNYIQQGAIYIADINNTLNFSIKNNQRKIQYLYAPVSTHNNIWKHIVCIMTYDSTAGNFDVDMYLNGVSVGTKSGTQPTTGQITINGPSYLGVADPNYLYTNRYFNGKMDEVAIFNRALDSTEIAALYGGTSPNIYPSNLIASNLNPIVYYPLGEQAQNTGKLPEATANVWQFPNGVLQDYVMDFNGNTGYINAGTEVGNSLGSSVADMTVSLWYKNTIGSNEGLFAIMSSITADSTDPFAISYNNNSIYVWFGSTYRQYSQTLDSDWHHLAVFKNGTSLAVYIDGSVASLSGQTGSIPATINTANKETFIGLYYNASFTYNGELSNVAIWNTDQSANIANIYNNGSPQTTYTVSPQNWWKLNATSVYTPSAPNYTTALNFDGASSTYITAGNNNSLSGPFTGYTISAWAKTPTSWESDYNAIFAKKYSFYFGLNTNHYLVLNPGSGTAFASYEVTSTTALNLDTWYHFLVTADGTNVKLYINGSLNKTQATTNTAQNSNTSNTPYIGGYDNAGDYDTWKGELSNIGFFNSALTSSQVSTLFNFGTPETNISFSPISWWKLDNLTTGIQDSGSASNNGTNNGASEVPSGVAVTPSWKIPSALTVPEHNYLNVFSFNGSNDYIQTSSHPIDFTTGDFTCSAWINVANDSNHQGIFGIRNSSSTSLQFYVRNDNRLASYNGSNDVFSTSTITNNVWNHVVLVQNGSNKEFYINGVPDNTVAQGNGATSTATFKIGYTGYGAEYLNGFVSNAQIFNTALSATGSNSVETLYNNGSPLTSMSGYSSLQGWWKLDSATITDSAGSNNGTNNGAEIEVSNVIAGNIPVNGVSTTLPSTALQQSDLQFDSPFSNYSLNFDGSGAYINTNFTIPAWTEYSISLWFKYTGSGNPTNYKAVLGAGSSGGNTDNRALIAFSGTNFYANMGTGTGAYWYDISSVSVTELFDGNWHHIALSVFETGQNLYIDGSLKYQYSYSNGSYLNPTTGFAGTSPYYINKFGSSGAGYLAQKIDELSFFDKKITDSEVLQIYNNGKPGDISSLSPKQWWRLGENAYFDNNNVTLPNSITGGPNGVSSGTATSMLSADAPGTYANGIGTNLDIIDRVGDAALSASNSQSYNMIPSDISPYVPEYVGDQIANNFSMTFDGANDYFNTNGTLASNLDFSVSAWINPTSYSTAILGTRTLASASTSNGITMNINSSGNLFGRIFTETSNITQVETGSTISLNNWSHVSMTYDSSSKTLKTYLNGSEVGSVAGSASSVASTAYFVIGRASVGTSGYYYFPGQIDEVAIFDTVLNAGQIYNDIYQPTATGSNKTADLENNPNLPNPVAWYRMGD